LILTSLTLVNQSLSKCTINFYFAKLKQGFALHKAFMRPVHPYYIPYYIYKNTAPIPQQLLLKV